MPVPSVGNVNSIGSGNNVLLLDVSLTVTSDANRVLVAIATTKDSSTTEEISSIVLEPEGVALPFTKQIGHFTDASGNRTRAEIWTLVNPPTGAQTIQAAYSDVVSSATLTVLQVNGVDQTTPIGATNNNTNTGTAVSVAVTTTAADSLVVGGMGHATSASVTPDASDTERSDNVGGTGGRAHNGWSATTEAPTTGSHTISGTASASEAWVMVGVELLAVSGGSPVTVNASIGTLSLQGPAATIIVPNPVTVSAATGVLSLQGPAATIDVPTTGITEIGITTFTTPTTVSGWSQNKPSGTQEGDVLIINIHTADGGVITPPSGWSLILNTQDPNETQTASYYKVAGASEPASYSWGISPNLFVAAECIAYRGVDNDFPIEISGGNNSGSSTTPTAGYIIPDLDESLLIFTATLRDNAGTSPAWTPPTGMTERADHVSSNRSGTTATLEVSRGTTGNLQATHAVSGWWSAHAYALRSATAPKPDSPYVVGLDTFNSGGVLTSSIVFDKPVGVQEDDLMVVHMTHGNSGSPTVTPPSGWALAIAAQTSTNSAHRTYYKVAGPSEPASYTFTLSVTKHPAGGLIALRNVNTSDPIDAINGAQQYDSEGAFVSADTPALTTTVDNTRMLFLLGIDAIAEVSPTSNLIEVWEEENNGRIAHGNHWEKLNAGALATKTVNWTPGGPGYYVVVASIAPSAVSPVVVIASTATLNLSGQAATVVAPIVVQVQTASIALSGQQATVSAHTTIQAQTVTLTLSGQAATVLAPLQISAGTGLLALTGVTAQIIAPIVVTANSGGVSFAGQPATVLAPIAVTASVATLTLSGQTATIAAAIVVQAQVASLTLSGQTATVIAPIAVQVQVATLTLSGQQATVQAQTFVQAQTASLSLSGQQAVVIAPIVVQAQVGVLSITGIAAANVGAGVVIEASVASVTFTGQAAAVLVAPLVQASTGQLSLSGQQATVIAPIAVQATVATLTLTGQAASVTNIIVAQAQTGALTFQGQAASIVAPIVIAAQSAQLSLAGQQATVIAGTTVVASTGVLQLAGQQATIQVPVTVSVTTATLTLLGQSATVVVAPLIVAQAGTLTIAGLSAIIDNGIEFGDVLLDDEALYTVELVDMSAYGVVLLDSGVYEVELEDANQP